MNLNKFGIISILSAGFLFASLANAQDNTTSETSTSKTEVKKPEDTKKSEKPAAASEDTSLGVNLEVTFSSAYVFRGYNIFQKDSQMNQYGLVAPGLSYTFPDTGLSFGYWGAFQLNGDNKSINSDVGLNLESDFYLSYSRKVTNKLYVKGILTSYVYFFAKDSRPTWVEPGVIAYSNLDVVRASIGFYYLLGTQEYIRDAGYLYINPSVSKHFKMGKKPVNLTLGYGYKHYSDGNEGMSNVHDLLLTVDTFIQLPLIYIRPGIGVAWTNIEAPDSTFSDGFVVWAQLIMGVDK
ncbi:MAG: hypothetical protein JXR95_04250 [Deltaproteobacteria bacterium]|nr:hypothetical protein [Deltaproteobacteria bacterium]